jgi:ATP-dependent helicase/nuclease subunit B
VDGRFPARELPHALFSEDDRRAINRWARRDVFRVSSGEPGARAAWRLAEDRLLFYLALSASRGPVLLSYARTAPSGAEQIPSSFLDEVARISGQKISSRPLAPICALGEVETELELRTRLTLEAFAPRALRTSEPELPAGAARGPFATEPWWGRAEALVEVERERMRFFSDPTRAPGPYSGAVADEALLPAIREAFAFGPKHPLDATSLGHFGNCAFQGFLHFILRLKDPEEPGEELDSRGQGTFWHRVLERLFPMLRDGRLLGKPPEEVPAALIDAALEAAVTRSEADTHVGHPVLWKLGRERARAMVRRLLAMEHRGLPFPALAPEATELAFGSSRAPEGWRDVALPMRKGAPVHLRGTIDRFDRGASGAGVLDYKAGSLARLKEGLLATHFQVPVYLHALRQSGEAGAVEGAWLSLKDGSPMLLSGMLEGQTVDELLATDPQVRTDLATAGKLNLANAVEGVVEGLRAGRFAARPQDCEWCSFRAICRISDRRIEEGYGG